MLSASRRLVQRTSFAASIAAAGLLLLGACGGSDADTGDNSSDNTSSSPEASDTDTSGASDTAESSTSPRSTPASTSASAPTSTELTKAGSTLSLGQTATVDWADSSDEAPARIQVTVNAVEKGSLEDFAGSSSQEKLAGYTPYYIDVTFTALADSAAEYPSPDSDVRGRTSGGASAQTLITIGLDKCSSPDFEKTWTAGASVTGCRALVVPDGQTLDEVSFAVGPDSSAGSVTWTV